MGSFQLEAVGIPKLEICDILIHPKKLRKALLPGSSLPKQTEQPAKKGGEKMRFFKMIMIVAVLVTALGLGACAQHKEVVTPAPAYSGK